jgi:hypothetical protein
MAFPSRPTKDQETATNFRPVSDAEFARLSTEEKFRHVHLGMLELTQALVELAATTAANQELRLYAMPTTGRAHGEE